MSPFRSVNTPKASNPPSTSEMPAASSPVPSESDDARPPPESQQSQPPPPPPTQPPNPAVDEATTPTRANFAATGMSAQRPLPSSPFPDFVATISELPAVTTPKRTGSQRSKRSRRTSGDTADMDMDESGGENAGSAGDSGSGNEASANKKKKTQRFYCTDYPPCNLSFTRSEHLARHIRKHTGERPFQCHCSRRFSRLDNLRQHAQTVHQNEEIPIDSPAAMGTRFQKQIRTDKMRQPPGGRSRASTAGSGIPPGRGHQKSLSTSVIGSNVSTILPSEGRRRPAAIVMPNDHRDAYAQDSRQGGFDGHGRGPPSPSGYHTPTSSTFSTGTNSPGWGSAGGPSPSPLQARSQMYNAYGDRVPGRRLSQPSSSHPFMSSPSRQWAQERNPPLSPYQQFSPYPGTGSLLPSPTTPTSSQWSRRESISSVADDAYRRRTWHPDTRDFAGASRLSQVISTSQLAESPVPPPLADRDHHDQEQHLRLPGIESFDPPQPPPELVNRQPSPMMIDSGSDIPRRRGVHIMAASREMSDQSDTSLNHGIMRLNIDQPVVRDSATAWADEASQAVLAQADQVRASHAPAGVRFEPEPVANIESRQTRAFTRHQHTVSAPINSYRDMPARGGMGRLWEANRAPVFTIQERRERPGMVHPNMSEFQGFPTRNDRPVVHQPSRAPIGPEAGYPRTGPQEINYPEASYREARRAEQPSRDDLRGLEALVAVATNEKFQDRDRSGAWTTAATPRATFELYGVRR